MSKCPDTERLVSSAVGSVVDLPTEHHLRACAVCRGDHLLIRRTRSALHAEIPVPEPLVEATSEAVRSLAHSTRDLEGSRWDVPIACFLGAATVVLGAVSLSEAGVEVTPDLVAMSIFGALVGAVGQVGTTPRILRWLGA